MNLSRQRYSGFRPYKMDPKFRVSVPVEWRPSSGEVLRLLFSRTHGMEVIKVLSAEAFDFRLRTIEESDLPQAEKSALTGSLYMLCSEASVNEQGKLLVPKDISEKAGIAADGEVVLAGRGMHFEVWSKANFAKVLEIEMNQSHADVLGVL